MQPTLAGADAVSLSAEGTNGVGHHASIPAELRDPKLQQWVAWRWVQRDGKTTKVLVNPHTGENADTTDPRTWGTFEQAVTRAAQNGLAGVGFVFTENDPYFGADWDHCLAPETGEFIDEGAANWVSMLDSYAEVSPSGTGVHVIGRGVLPERGRKRGNREMYDSKRFFTVTGKHLAGTPTTIRNAQKVLLEFHADTFPDSSPNRSGRTGGEETGDGGYEVWNNGLTDEQVIVKAASSKHGEKFRRLFYDGNTSGYKGDSEADMGLVALIGFWSGPDPEQLDRIMRRSALARAKWDEPRAGISWIRYTIDNALRDRTEFYTGADSFRSNIVLPPEKKRLQFRPLSEIFDESGDETDWVFKGIAARGALTDFVGRAKHAGKTTFIAQAASRALEGKPFLGNPTERVPVLFLTEQGANIRKPLKDAGLDRDTDGLYVMQWKETLGASWPEIVEATKAEALRVGAGLVIVDTVNRFAGLQGDDENSAGHVMAALRPLVALAQELNVAVVAVRHANKLGEGRGSTAFDHEVDILLKLKRPLGGYDSNVRELDGMGRYDDIPKELMIELTNKGYRIIGTGGDVALRAAMDQLLEIVPTEEDSAMRRDVLIDELNEEFDVSRSTAGRAISASHKKGDLVRLGEGKKGDPHRYYSPFTPEEREAMLAEVLARNSFRSNRGEEGTKQKTETKPEDENPIGKRKTPPAVSVQTNPSQKVSKPFEKKPDDEFDTPPDNPIPQSVYEIRPAMERLDRPANVEEIAAEADLTVAAVTGHIATGTRGGIIFDVGGGRYALRPNPPKRTYLSDEAPNIDLDS